MVYVSDRQGRWTSIGARRRALAQTELLYTSPSAKFTSDWSFNNRFIVFDAIGIKTRFDIWAYGVDAHSASPIIQTPFVEREAKLTRDGQ